MNILPQQAPHRQPVRTAAAQRKLQRQLDRFSKRHRKPIEALAAQHLAIADLAFSFPALLFALACPHRGMNRHAVLAAAREGASLKTLAKRAAIPFWLRKLPPEAFTKSLQPLPDDPVFIAQIGNLLPKSPSGAARWLCCAEVLADISHGPFVLWALRLIQPQKIQTRNRFMDIRLVGLWAWVSMHGVGAAAELLDRKWSPRLSYESASESASRWWDCVNMKLFLGAAPITDVWFEPGEVDGFNIQPLETAAAIDVVARDMRNCIRSYGASVAENRDRLWHVVKDQRTIAVFSVSKCSGLQCLTVTELRARNNGDVPNPVAVAVRKWLLQQDPARLLFAPETKVIVPDRMEWCRLWMPYWKQRRKFPDWLPIVTNTGWPDGLSYRPSLW